MKPQHILEITHRVLILLHSRDCYISIYIKEDDLENQYMYISYANYVFKEHIVRERWCKKIFGRDKNTMTVNKNVNS